ncbi:MAG: hydroxymethylglutaryl-CoA lyase [Endozoicomonas sp. (ex Botrylloides leachii)]|nr:hydroxymethylglutaryl-CoA lyase [Endozoicomonas sp. (ex Botrylloides leachii)]
MQQVKTPLKKIKLVEVGPRDGLQNISPILPVEARARLIDNLAHAGLKHIEAGSFVSPVKVPAMADSANVFQLINRKPDIVYSALTPNLRGFEQAMEAHASEVAVFISASEGFSQHNINCSIADSLTRIKPVIEAANQYNCKVRGYISCVMGCPYDGKVRHEEVAQFCHELIQMGCYEVSLGDTIGVGTPLQAKALFHAVAKLVPIEAIAAHFHNTYGQALANLYALIEEGLLTIDSAIAGLGGCPYAPGASGNVATEDVVYMLNGMGIISGVDLQGLVTAAEDICQCLGVKSAANAGIALSYLRSI